MLSRFVKTTVFAGVAALSMSAAASAATFNLASSGFPLATDQTVSRSIVAAGPGSAVLSFALLGYASLDGNNFYEDDFSLTVNGNLSVKATFDLGGGGFDQIFTAPGGASFNNLGFHNGSPQWNGGTVLVSVPVTLVAGLNTFDFSYVALPSPNAGFQGVGDEGWGFSRATVVTSAVPEPTTWAMMLAGFAGLAFFGRRRLAARAA